MLRKMVACGLLCIVVTMAGCSNESEEKGLPVEKKEISTALASYENDALLLAQKAEFENLNISEKCKFGKVKTSGEFNNLSVITENRTPAEFAKVINEYMAQSDRAEQYNGTTDLYLVDHELYTQDDQEYNEWGMYPIGSLKEERLNKNMPGDSFVAYSENAYAINFYGSGLGYYGNNSFCKYNPLGYGENAFNYFQPFKYLDGKEAHFDCCQNSKDDIETFENVKYDLLDGEMSASEAYDVFMNNIGKYYVNADSKRSFQCDYVDVLRIKDKYSYMFEIQLVYDDIAFLNDNIGSYSVSEFSTMIPFQCYIAESNDITALVALKGDVKYEVDETVNETYELESALRLVSDKLADNVKFMVNYIDFGYAQFNQGKSYRLGWLFSGTNETRNESMAVFVDAIEGKVYMNVGE